MQEQRIKDTKLGVWMKAKVPDVFDAVKDALPEQGVLGVVKNLIGSEDPEANALIAEIELERQKEVTKRWQADMSSDSKLSKMVRPLTLVFLSCASVALIVFDSIMSIEFEVKDAYIQMIQAMSMTAFGAYFAGRSYEKVKR